MLNQDQFGIIQNLQTSPTYSQNQFLVSEIFATSYSKAALVSSSSMYGQLDNLYLWFLKVYLNDQ